MELLDYHSGMSSVVFFSIQSPPDVVDPIGSDPSLETDKSKAALPHLFNAFLLFP
jgi:hypothetical protein